MIASKNSGEVSVRQRGRCSLNFDEVSIQRSMSDYPSSRPARERIWRDAESSECDIKYFVWRRSRSYGVETFGLIKKLNAGGYP